MKIEIEVKDEYTSQDGQLFEPTGEFRAVKAGEYFVNAYDSKMYKCSVNTVSRYAILRSKCWRAKEDTPYYYVDSNLSIGQYIEDGDSTDDGLYQLGNYYKTKELAQETSDKIALIHLSTKG